MAKGKGFRVKIGRQMAKGSGISSGTGSGTGTTDITIYYLETSMTTKKTLPSRKLLTRDVQQEIMAHGISYARRILNLRSSEAHFDCSFSSAVGDTVEAGDYDGDVFIRLDEKHMWKGFQGQLGIALMAHTALVDEHLLEQQATSSSKLSSKQRKQILQLKDTIGRLEVANSIFIEEIKGLKKEVSELKITNMALQERIDELQDSNRMLITRVDSFKSQAQVANKIWLRIALETAHDRLMKDLGRSPNDSGWPAFIESITPNEMQQFGLTVGMLHLLKVGKKQLNRAAHDASIIAVALAITSVRSNSENWKKIFSYGYGQDADQLVFDDLDVDLEDA